MDRPVLESGRSRFVSDHDENVHNDRLLYGRPWGVPVGTWGLCPASGW